jgi:hypothetical protein
VALESPSHLLDLYHPSVLVHLVVLEGLADLEVRIGLLHPCRPLALQGQ